MERGVNLLADRKTIERIHQDMEGAVTGFNGKLSYMISGDLAALLTGGM